LQKGLCNLDRHLQSLGKFRVPVLVAINRFKDDAPELLDQIGAYCRSRGVESAVVDVFAQGGAGAMELAEKTVALLAEGRPDGAKPLYTPELSLLAKVETVAREVYGAAGVYTESDARKKLARYEKAGYGRLPVCIAKTQSSLSDDPKKYGSPSGWTLTVTDAHLASGAGFVVVIAGNMMRMPGLGKEPQAVRMDVDDAGVICGLR
ncbi:MAG: formate--tetrahydrofolate ligase, partial [Acidobacteria bacterium]|nr:formate--tetrahydrofolate ligase [Acidobacteriota bacterium]